MNTGYKTLKKLYHYYFIVYPRFSKECEMVREALHNRLYNRLLYWKNTQ